MHYIMTIIKQGMLCDWELEIDHGGSELSHVLRKSASVVFMCTSVFMRMSVCVACA